MKNNKLMKVVSLVMALAIIISMAIPFASAANKQPNCGLSYSRVTGNADKKNSMPKTITKVRPGSEVYFNFQVDSSKKVKQVKVFTLYKQRTEYRVLITRDSFHKSGSDSAKKDYMRYTPIWFFIDPFMNGYTLYYYFKVEYTNGKKWESPIMSAEVTWDDTPDTFTLTCR